jgi:hypothetical protein
MKWAGSTTGMSSCTRPSGKRRLCASQKDRRHSLFHAVRSPSRGRKRVTWVFNRVAAKVFCTKRSWLSPLRSSR